MYKLNSVVGMSRTAADGKMKLGAIVDALQDCNSFEVEEYTEFYHYTQKHSLSIFVAFQQIDIVNQPIYKQKLVTKSWIFKTETFRGNRNTLIYDTAGTLLVKSYGIGVFVDLKTGLPCRNIPKDILEDITTSPPFDMEYLPRRIPIPKVEPEIFEAYTTKKYQVDVNNHINNARYLDIAVEYLPDDFSVKRMTMQYKAPAKYGDILYPKKYVIDNNHIVTSLDNHEEEPVIIIAFYS